MANLKRKSGKVKRFWRGTFSLNCSQYVMYCYAWSEIQAKEIFIRRIADAEGVAHNTVRRVFDGTGDNYLIEETEKEKSWREYR